MDARGLALLGILTLSVTPAAAEKAEGEVTRHGGIAPAGDEVRLVTIVGGNRAGATLQVGSTAATTLAKADAVGALEVAHGTLVVALAISDAKEPFRIVVGDKVTKLARPAKRFDVPFALALASTPTGFTAFFQEIEAANTNEAHTYMVKLDKTGAPDGELREVAVPWWLGDAAWNGKGYHLGLYYAASSDGIRLSMVTTDEAGGPQQHPDWASPPGMIADLQLVARGGKVTAYYRGGVGDQIYATDVTTIGQWGGTTQSAKRVGALAQTSAIAITAKGQPVVVTAKAKK